MMLHVHMVHRAELEMDDTGCLLMALDGVPPFPPQTNKTRRHMFVYGPKRSGKQADGASEIWNPFLVLLTVLWRFLHFFGFVEQSAPLFCPPPRTNTLSPVFEAFL